MDKISKFIDSLVEDFSEHMKMDSVDKSVTDGLSGHGIRIMHMLIGKSVESSQYGYILGFFEYKNENYKFRYHVHTPKQRFPILSNKMTNLDHITLRETDDVEYIDTCSDEMTNQFCEAFWSFNRLCDLEDNPEAYALRILMQNITAWSRQEKLCQYFARHDRQRIRYEESH